MNRRPLVLAATLAVLAAALPAAAPAAARPYRVDALHSSVGFSVPYELMVLGEVQGWFRDFAGHVTYDREDVSRSSVRVAIQATSLDTGFAPRDRHLRGPDFFDADRYPVITFESRRVERTPEGHRLVGMLRLRGVEQEVTVPFRLVEVGETLVVSGTLWLDRRTFGIGTPAELAAGAFRLGDRVSVTLHLIVEPDE